MDKQVQNIVDSHSIYDHGAGKWYELGSQEARDFIVREFSALRIALTVRNFLVWMGY